MDPIITGPHAKRPMWLLDEAMRVVRELQFKALQNGFHLALCGGVLNKGYSAHDLDIAVFPLDSRGMEGWTKFLAACPAILGPRVEIENAPTSAPDAENLLRFITAEGKVSELLVYKR